MEFLRQIFEPSKDQVWRQLSREIGGEFIEKGFLERSKIRVQIQEWTVTLDTYSSGDADSSTTYTRIRAPYVNKDGFRFMIYRQGWLGELGKLFGSQDVEVGFADFDRDFIIKGNDESKLRALFENARIRQLIQAQPSIHLEVKDDEGWFGEIFPDGVDELHFEVPGIIKNIEHLRSLYELFAETLNHLCHIGSAYQDDPRLSENVSSSSRGFRQVGKICLVAGGLSLGVLVSVEGFKDLAFWAGVSLLVIGLALILLARWRR